MKLSTHYYVLFLGETTSRLYESFRDSLIDIQNNAFPMETSAGMIIQAESTLTDNNLRKFISEVDEHFDHYFKQDPLRVVVVGSHHTLSIFDEVTSHRGVLLGRLEGDYATTSPNDLGKIVWPVVKKVMAGAREQTMYDLESAESSQNLVSGIKAVVKSVCLGAGDALFVEEDYSMKGGIHKSDSSFVSSENLDIQEVIDDVVDAVIEKVLENGGIVVFVDNGLLKKFERIALVSGY